MKIRKLLMRAFGPYGKEVILDFAGNLDKDNMFVIAGNTGAGKTTIFDAINFALYGEASSKTREVKGLRSNFASEDYDTVVELTFTLKGNEYVVRRNPEYLRKKKSGEGYTTKKADATLDINGGASFDGGDTITGATKVTEAIKDILGISSEQFKQLVMIPQGEFKRLLHAKSEEKEKIFRKIFETEVISKFQDTIREKANKLKGNTGLLSKQRDGKLREYLPIEESKLKPLLDAKELNINLILNNIKDEIKIEESFIKEKEDIKKIKVKEKEDLLTLYNEGKAINEAIEGKVKAEIEVKEILRGSEENKKREEIRDLGKRAIEVSIKEDIFNKVDSDLIISKDKLDKLNETMKVSKEKKENAEKEYLMAEKEALRIKDIEKELDSLKELKEKTGIYEEKKNILKNVDSESEKAKSLVVSLENEKKDKTLKTEEIKNYIEKCSVMKDEKIKLETEKIELQNLKKAINEFIKNIDILMGDEENLKELTSNYEESEKLVRHREKLFNEAEDKLFRNQAGILASKLRENEKCPVCGSINHPEKAKIEDDDITKEEVERLKKTFNEANNSLIKLKTEILKLREKIEENKEILKEQGKEMLGVEEEIEKYKILAIQKGNDINSRGKEVVENLSRIDKTLEKEHNVKREIESLEKIIEAKEKVIEENKKRINELEIEKAKEKKDIEEIEKRFNGEIKSLEYLNSRERELLNLKKKLEDEFGVRKEMLEHLNEKLQKLLGEIKSEDERIKNLIEELKKAEEIYIEECKINGFNSLNEYKLAKKNKEELRDLDILIENYNTSLKEKNAVLEEKRKAAEGKEKIDIEGIIAKGKGVANEINLIDKALNNLISNFNNNVRVIKSVEKLNKDIEKEEKEYKKVGSLSEIINGNNDKKITLERYILAAYLDDILRAANKRLLRMSNNRYRLLRKKTIGDKRVGQGLDLQVFDSYSNKERDVTSLSGGESFKASLSMALGLSDVVQSTSGGIRLDTMFIDEGFGTLDAESLESAIDILAELQGGGRIVGVISHVEELKNRIPKKIIVHGDRGGSTATFLG
ncbi:MAG: AAA family ATPase [Clostridium sp.]